MLSPLRTLAQLDQHRQVDAGDHLDAAGFHHRNGQIGRRAAEHVGQHDDAGAGHRRGRPRRRCRWRRCSISSSGPIAHGLEIVLRADDMLDGMAEFLGQLDRASQARVRSFFGGSRHRRFTGALHARQPFQAAGALSCRRSGALTSPKLRRDRAILTHCSKNRRADHQQKARSTAAPSTAGKAAVDVALGQHRSAAPRSRRSSSLASSWKRGDFVRRQQAHDAGRCTARWLERAAAAVPMPRTSTRPAMVGGARHTSRPPCADDENLIVGDERAQTARRCAQCVDKRQRQRRSCPSRTAR